MRRGRIWVVLDADAEPEYGDAVHMVVMGDKAGCFSTEGGVTIAGRFIGSAQDGLAPVELFGTDVASSSDDNA
jgi:hypothetical protein